MTDRHSKRIRLFQRGEPFNRAREHNEPREALNRLLTGALPPQQIGRKAQRSPQIRQVKVVSEQGDYLTVRFVSGSTVLPGDYFIAKPYLLRRTPFDGEERAGVTYTYTSDNARSATDGSESEDQVIVPSYEAGDLIHVLTPVYDIPTQVNTKVTGIDLNTDGRAWAKVAS